jgi:hypothetical protein
MGGANVTCPLAIVCRKYGHEVVVIAEGLAAGIFEKAGFTLHFKGTVNFVDEPFTIDVYEELQKIKPHTIVTGLGSPINLEEQFGLVANELGIPLVECVDFWSGVNRSSANPDVVLALDEYDAQLTSQLHPAAKVKVVGNPGVLGPGSAVPAPEVAALREEYKAIYTYVGGGDRTADEIEFLIACLKKTTSDWCLIPRLHPKHAKRACLDEGRSVEAGGRTYGEVWSDMLSVLGDRVVYLPHIGKSDSVVIASDATFASWSTLLTTSAQAGKVTASLWVPSAREELKELTRLDQVPIVELGCCHSLTEPVDLAGLTPPDPAHVAKLKPYDPEVAYKALMQCVTPA